MTKILLVLVFACFILQKIAEGIWGGRVDAWFALKHVWIAGRQDL